MQKISSVIICKNEEQNIDGCLKSIEWVDEIILVDAYSTDKTIEIAGEFPNVKIIQNEWKGYASQRKFGLSKSAHDWTFILDADERCTPELQNEIISSVRERKNVYGYYIPRKSFFLGKWIKHGGWYPGYQMRLFRKEFTGITDRMVHEGYEVEGETAKLKNDILHYTVTNLSSFMNRVNKYSDLTAKEKSGIKKIKLTDLLFRPAAAFIQSYIIKRGFLDGIHGLMVSHFHMITNMLTYMKVYEIQNQKTKE
jgi:glycosyltransferase involved in cell wall biosynthesis